MLSTAGHSTEGCGLRLPAIVLRLSWTKWTKRYMSDQAACQAEDAQAAGEDVPEAAMSPSPSSRYCCLWGHSLRECAWAQALRVVGS